MDIYADPITINCRKVIAGLKLMGHPYRLHKVDYFKGEQKSPEYLAINPNASIPAMRDGSLTLWESNAILIYAAEKYGANGAYPDDPEGRADVNRWMFWESASWFPACYTYLVENCVKPLLGGQPDAAVVAANEPTFHKLAGILADRLAGQEFVAGSGPTIADITLAAPMHLHDWQQLPLGPHAAIRAWIERVEALPCWAETAVYEGFTTERKAAAE